METRKMMNDEEMEQISGGFQDFRVEAGETLEKFAMRHHVSVDQLIRWNNIKDPGILRAGMMLRVQPEKVKAEYVPSGRTGEQEK